MKRSCMRILLLCSVLALPHCVQGVSNDLEHLGYSEEMIKEVESLIPGTVTKVSEKAIQPTTTEASEYSPEDSWVMQESASVQQQLTELGVTRAITPDMQNNAENIRCTLDNYWNDMLPHQHSPSISDEVRDRIFTGIHESLTMAGYEIINLELVDLPEGNEDRQLKAVVRVTRPIKTGNSYAEIQKNLVEITKLSKEAATFNGHCFLSEMTTFVAENPRNNYYYEKTILTPKTLQEQ